MPQPNVLTPGQDQSLDLGILLGERRALTLVAGRCAAAHAELLRQIRDQKLYLPYAPTWAGFCAGFMTITRRHADRLIAILNEFGPIYFELAELVGITPEQYRLIEPCVRENAIHVGDEAIAFIPANSTRVAEAISEILQRRAPHPNSHPLGHDKFRDKLASLERKGRALAAQYELLHNERNSAKDREAVSESIQNLRILFGSIDPTAL
jgi:hypothetical protein